MNDIGKIFHKLSLELRSTGHTYGWLVDKKKILRVHYSHGKGDLPEKIMHKIRGQLKLSEKDFKDLVACPLTYEGYLDILKRKGFINS
jgi:hypothetical protein